MNPIMHVFITDHPKCRKYHTRYKTTFCMSSPKTKTPEQLLMILLSCLYCYFEQILTHRVMTTIILLRELWTVSEISWKVKLGFNNLLVIRESRNVKKRSFMLTYLSRKNLLIEILFSWCMIYIFHRLI